MQRLLLMIAATAALWGAGPKFLMPEEAFIPSARVVEGEQIEVRIELAKDIYLYEDKVEILDADPNDAVTVVSVARPEAVDHDGERVFLPSPIFNVMLGKQEGASGAHNAALLLKYQGCSEQGLCYEPLEKRFDLRVDVDAIAQAVAAPSAPSVAAPVVAVSESDTIAQTLKEGSVWYILLSFLGFGLLLALTPCVFPMIPILSSVIVAQGKNITTKKAFLLSLVYVLAMAAAYTIAGVLAGLFGANLQAAFQTPWVIVLFSLIFVALSLSMFDYYQLQMPAAIQSRINSVSENKGGYVGVALMGFFSALIVGPCVAAPLAGALIYIGQTGDAVLGGMALFALSIGMGFPLLLVGTSAGRFMPKPGAWMDAIKSVFGVMLLGVSIWMISRVIPESITLFLWSFLLIGTAVNMGAFESVRSECPRCPKAITKSMGIIIFLYGLCLFLGGVTGAKNPLNPLEKFTQTTTLSAATLLEASFAKVTSIAELDAAMARAKGKKVLVDFYADWCVACKELEHNTFADPAVKAKMAEFVLIQADVTANGESEKALSKKYGVFGPPAILFFDENGAPNKGKTVIGYQESALFLAHLNSL
ncbi:MAG: protein-disulfide reductase DsbD [Campylobacterales bacterium]|nr:protein-disulfide reductase DsbD [Campylobacterales bacterium]